MSDFSSEESENKSENVRRGGFGDFMFGPHFHHHESSSSDSSSSSSDHSTSESPSGSQKDPSREHPRNCGKLKWQNSAHSNTQTKICWADGSMWEFRMRRRPR
ncbi:hypothetical protein L1999_18630 [Neobacillus drentensis]|uniref:hypothetical protein n=1 Tax=Neobacillus drentensis TaxID=220684 RepID=UPI001F1D388E|nr:hypothetical protein [Neobacillus drentensis]ULT55134.1 hypothetical protein L1999_18630 [Neobacillus drentensis]